MMKACNRFLDVENDQDVGLQIAPMVNLVVILVAVFVFASSSKIMETEMGVMLPAGMGVGRMEPVVLYIEPSGAVRFNNQSVPIAGNGDMTGLVDRLLDIRSTLGPPSVILRPHADSTHQHVISVLSACSEGGVLSVGFAGQ